ncbi:hypothetical protein SEI61121_06411 [Salmonella enterica subsp. indica serovar 6,14,25:z10:1,(2),7 str. 1121]|uniref:Uncharacterized protein n=1 Tax=Salmonella enterica subsp. indica serovar 6,14,25:z10:1,(2),7 str. 1121 TaxID=1173950 RepID=V1HUK8_SALER|nr:hypothetical protein SEI61121_06411 [Salmonella enterica subsp. indica serovar 6,14,25:z10:1,(2),7 str. 1121]
MVFRAGLTERKFSRLYDIIIPDDLSESDISAWLPPRWLNPYCHVNWMAWNRHSRSMVIG